MFPLYPCIRANVQFWEDVYSRYTTRQGIVHDIDDLSRVYGVIDLEDRENPDAAQTNSERIKTAKSRISELLAGLGEGKRPETAEEKRIAALFEGQPLTAVTEASANLRVQVGQKDRFYEGLIRSGKYLEQFKRHFAAQGLPMELAYLPHVESSFNPKAYSKVGAAGLWQFTRSTGKEFLTVNHLVDERCDPYQATKAAAQLLKQNYTALKSWPLALTAYNYGRAGMIRAVEEKGSYEQIFKSFNQGSFKFAARNFYSEFLAALRVAKRMGSDPRIPFEQPEATITRVLNQEVPIGRLRSSYQISAEQFAQLNPALQQPVLEGKESIPKGFLVRLPAAKPVAAQATAPRQVRTAAVVSPLAAAVKRSAPKVRYTVKKGDTLTSIARRFQLTPQELVAANGGSSQASVRTGEDLVIPMRLSEQRDR